MPLSSFDFKLLSDRDFKEDSVREEIITPVLRYLGYSASPPTRIVRSKALVHPFVHIGTKRFAIKIIPDYLLEVDGKAAWILDAKGPRETIHKGASVEQAFSYAIHPDVRAFTYALCNGHRLLAFSVSRIDPILDVDLRKLNEHESELKAALAPNAFRDASVTKFRPDFGIYCRKVGIAGSTRQHFYGLGLPSIAKLADGRYTSFLNLQLDGEWYALSLDFDAPRYRQLLEVVGPILGRTIDAAVQVPPHKLDLNMGSPVLNVVARVGRRIIQDKKEAYCPLIVDEFSLATT